MGKKSMADIWKDMEKAHGEEGLYSGDSSMTDYSETIPTGSFALDDALGVWGVPKGTVVQYAGFESSGKTLLALCTVAEWQKKSPENWAMFVDAEFTFDKMWAESLGVDTSRLYVLRENKAADVFDRLVGVPGKRGKDGTVKKVKPGVLDMEKENGGTGLGLIVIDSIAALQPPQEEASASGKDNMALMARFLPPVLRKITPMLAETGVTLIAINQLRMQPGVMYGDPTMSTGGTAIKYASSIIVNLGMIKSSETNIVDEAKEQIGHRIRAKVQKNKKAPPFRTAQFDIKYLKGIVNKNHEIRDVAARYGVIERPNNKVWVLDDVKYNGKDAMAEAILEEALAATIIERTKEAKKNFRGAIETDQGEESNEAEQEESSEE